MRYVYFSREKYVKTKAILYARLPGGGKREKEMKLLTTLAFYIVVLIPYCEFVTDPKQFS